MRRHVRRILGALAALAIIAAVLLGQFGRANAREQIVGGDRAAIADHPYVVYLATADGFQFCGGTLVTRDKVVTAAHCAKAVPVASIRVVAGREDKQAGTGLITTVSEAWIHPGYSNVTGGDDVAVLTLTQRLPYRPLPLAAADDQPAGTPATILGWGRTSDGGPPSRYLLKAEVPLIADTECARDYNGFTAPGMVCAGVPEGGVDTCQGDSGGPLVVAGRLVGIASWGEGCAEAGKPGVYTRVTEYADLITAHL
ncbi:serine protease [Actinokineospora sp. NBRC 105648]|uniref:S1 family peptidase n=1 Tax=Actinokineospora sp. NBRC 105648 TaxID=3032206 RepID=UPI0024A1B3E5|nr:serine protease [Actinokineospora sp. NBRC 105648]GLZ41440.1 serine protease [Actinokineospora sp. NBRC 105648]